jgi:hypothetical protein
MAKKFTVGTAVRITVEIRDSSNVLTDPAAAVITITDPDGTVKITEAAMSRQSTGIWYYIWQSSESDAYGLYCPKVKATASDGYISRKAVELFGLWDKVES